MIPVNSSFAYQSDCFINSFAHHGETVKLPNSNIPFIKKAIDGKYFDLTGIYPFSRVCE